MTRILIVDDKEENLYYLRSLLTGHGFTVDSARHGAEALVIARQAPPDAIISDLLMPVMDGYTLLRHWKADNRLRKIPFAVYTATYTEREDEQLALDLGADAFILKPAEPEDFLLRLREIQAKAAAKSPLLPSTPVGDDRALLEVYNKTLIRKLEEKTLQQEETNQILRQDIAKRQQVEEQLRWRTALFEALMDSSIDGILVVDSHGKILLQNQRINELLKIPRHLALDMKDAEQLQFATNQAKNPEEFAEGIAYLEAHPDEIGHDEVELIDGIILDRSSWPIRDKTGAFYGRIWYFRDITERRNLETQFRQAQKMEAIGQLAGGVAHDFNNILAVILMQAGLMTLELDITDQVRTFASEIEKAAQRAGNLTRQLLLFSRQQAMQSNDFDLRDAVTNMSRMLQRILGEDIRLQFKLAPVPLAIHADAGMIDQILLNLTVNARDAMPAGGELIIETAAVEFDEVTAEQAFQGRAGSFACMSVTDTGCGIPPENLSRIFEPFFTTKDVGKGTGIGLATVFGIVQQHQGWINVYSEVGRGTTLRVYLPRLSTPVEGMPVQTQPLALRGGTETILLLEDDFAVRASMTDTLSSLGYRVLEAGTGAEALEVWEKYRDQIDLLLTDLVLPGGMTGGELAGKLIAQVPQLRVIYSSGYSSEIVNKHVRLEEGVNFLSKPFETRKLAQTVRNRLDMN
jgi:signal transduction histidine kinase/FixJ family two-component response regulator